jgi:phosphonate transport system ATP-binding protein
MNAIDVHNLSKKFGRKQVLHDVSLTIAAGEMVGLIGPSGAGKSTLMRHINGLVPSDRHASHVRVHDRAVQTNGRIAGDIRTIRSDIGFIFQQFNLVGRLSLLTNVLTGRLARTPWYRRLIGRFTHAEKMRAMEALDFVGLADQASQRASTLSGGQQQRGAVARAIVQQARTILADEPIASLDPESARLVMDGLRRMNDDQGTTVVVSLHQIDFATRFCDRIIAMKDGRIACDCPADQLHIDRLKMIYGESYEAVLATGGTTESRKPTLDDSIETIAAEAHAGA